VILVVSIEYQINIKYLSNLHIKLKAFET